MLGKSQDESYSNQQDINQTLGYNNVYFLTSSQAEIIGMELRKLKENKTHKITPDTVLRCTDRCLEKLKLSFKWEKFKVECSEQK